MGFLLALGPPLAAESVDETEKARVWKEKVEHALADAAKALRESKSAQDFDDPLQALEFLDRHLDVARTFNLSSGRQAPSLVPRLPSGSGSLPGRDIPAILSFLKQWQVYLVLEESGDEVGTWQAVQSLKAPDADGLMPRSELLQIIDEAKRAAAPDGAQIPDGGGIEEGAEAIVAGVEELGGLNPALKRLRMLLGAANNGMVAASPASKRALASLIHQLQFLDRNYQDLKFGLPTSLALQAPPMDNGVRSDGDIYGPHLARLKSAYLAFALPHFLGLPAEVKPDPNEDLSAFVKKTALTREENADPRFLLRCQEALSFLQRGSSKTASDTAGLRAYLTGRNQEIAGQREQAVAAYLEALESGDELLPAEAIGKRLQALQEPPPAQTASPPDQSPPAPAPGEAPSDGGEGNSPTWLPHLLLALAAAGALWLLFRKRRSNPS